MGGVILGLAVCSQQAQTVAGAKPDGKMPSGAPSPGIKLLIAAFSWARRVTERLALHCFAVSQFGAEIVAEDGDD